MAVPTKRWGTAWCFHRFEITRCGKGNHMKSRSLRTIVIGLSLAALSPVLVLADDDDVVAKVSKARETFNHMQRLVGVYNAKLEVAVALQTCEQYRREVEATVRRLRIAVDGMPMRRNSVQQMVYDDWLAGRNELTETDRQIAGLRSRLVDIDESVLAMSAVDGQRLLPSNRRDILIIFPEAQRACRQAFDELRTAAVASQNGRTLDQIIREANNTLNRSGEGDARFGPPAAFFAEWKKFNTVSKRSSQTRPPKSPSKTRSRK